MTNNVNINEVLEELKNYKVSDYQVTDLMKGAVRDNISGMYKVFANDRDLQLRDTIQNSTKATIEHMKQVYGSMTDAKLYKFMTSISNHVRYDLDQKNQFYIYDYGLVTFIDLLQCVISGEQSQDLRNAIDCKDKHPNAQERGINIEVSHPDYPDITLTAKIFKNGHAKVSGLTKEHVDRLNYMFEFYKDKGYNLGKY